MHFLVLVAVDVETWKSVDLEVEAIMEKFVSSTNAPEYLEFCDCTEELKKRYRTGTVNCIKTPGGRFVKEGDWVCRQYDFVGYPISKLYRSFEQFAEKSEEFVFHEEQGGYGYYYNPNGICDWYEVGGCWSQLFLVKDSCTEFFYEEFSSSEKEVEAPEGYQWVCAARKKEIAWEAARELLPELKDRKYHMIPSGFVRDGVWIPAILGQSLTSWEKAVDEWISGLDDNAVLVGVDCHK